MINQADLRNRERDNKGRNDDRRIEHDGRRKEQPGIYINVRRKLGNQLESGF